MDALAGTIARTHDGLDRLTEETTPLGSVSYTYDAANRRTSLTLPNGVTVAYTYDLDSRVTGLAYGANGTQLGNLAYTYDADGRRTAKTVNGATTQFPGACPPRKRRDGLNPVAELDGASPPNVTANLLTGLGLDEYFTRSDASGTMAFMTDALGSTVGLVNSAGGIDTSYTYQPFGATTVNGTNANPYQFTGRESDGNGLYFYRARYYSSTYQRFIAQDPIELAIMPHLTGSAIRAILRL